jgi:hypothetical protein
MDTRFTHHRLSRADPGGRAIYGLRTAAPLLLEIWFRILPGYGCLFLVSVECCHVQVSASGRSLVWRSPTECVCISVCVCVCVLACDQV